ncbi:glycoside hydrolase family 3 N-terminal domain-containing protein [uncultured Dysosmobacter sp.]|uniref:glycoside hydrolase family 3 N-terminal domain-containing protein n=1 Tax=uncultured Dysosmobacter sp. TaxID=2591384 RepID=UPI002615C017|nr:glycoside hydrolase family 3 N-terminal domain-containing protein [uncultured Dysosmobacter sp.]
MRRFFLAVLTAFLIGVLAACGAPAEGGPTAPAEPPAEESPAKEPEAPPSTEPEAPVDPMERLLSSMTLEEKVGQLFFVRVPADSAVEDVGTYHLGGYILFGRDTQDRTANDLIQTIQRYQDAAAIPLLIGVDEEGGTVVRVSSNPHLRASKFKSPQKLSASGGMEAITADTHEKDVLLHALGFNVNLAPVADVSTSAGDFIYSRSFGQNASATADYVAQVTARMTADGMSSVLKHFPGYGNNVDTHTGIAVDQRPLETFETSDFLPFQAGIQAGGKQTAVLVSHNIMTCVDDALPASLSPAVHEILRGGLGFDGVVMTDDLAMDAVAAYAKDGAVAVMALEAGNDLIITTDYRTQIPKVIEAVESGVLEEPVIDAACLRVLRWKSALGLLTE